MSVLVVLKKFRAVNLGPTHFEIMLYLDQLGPMTRLKLSIASGIPRETIRRKNGILIQRGYVELMDDFRLRVTDIGLEMLSWNVPVKEVSPQTTIIRR